MTVIDRQEFTSKSRIVHSMSGFKPTLWNAIPWPFEPISQPMSVLLLVMLVTAMDDHSFFYPLLGGWAK